jgi:hypothetical protein
MEQETKRYILLGILFIVIIIFSYFALPILIKQANSPVVQPRYAHKYQCDGKLLDDECNNARVTVGGTWIGNCKSGNEYICQSIVEMPN